MPRPLMLTMVPSSLNAANTAALIATSGVVPWLTAVLGAILGFAIREGYAAWKENQAFEGLLRELQAELSHIRTVAAQRACRPMEYAGDAEPPLPVEAWRLATASGKLGRLPAQKLGRLRSLYSEVAAANSLAQHWSSFLLISRLSTDDDVKSAFDKEAARVIRVPCIAVSEHVDMVLADLDVVVAKRANPLRRLAKWVRR